MTPPAGSRSSSLVVLLLTTAVSLLVGARLYEGSLLRTNGRTSVATAWREREHDRLSRSGEHGQWAVGSSDGPLPLFVAER